MTVQIKRWAGLNTDANPHGSVPEGAMRVARNVVHRRLGMLEPRPGLWNDGDLTWIAAAEQLHRFDGAILVLNGRNGAEAAYWHNNSTEILDESGNSLDPYEGFCSAQSARKNLYVGTERGVLKLTDSGSFEAQDVNMSPIVYFALNTTTGGDWWTDTYSVGYRVLLKREDSNGLIVRSAPSSKVQKTNSAGADRRAVLTLYKNQDMKEGDILEVYRTKISSSSLTSETYKLALGHEITAADLAGDSFQITDSTAELERGENLYTNESQEGTGYERPWAAKVLTEYQGSLFGFNLTSPYYYDIELPAAEDFAPSNPTAGIGRRNQTITATLGSDQVTVSAVGGIQVGTILYEETIFPSGAVIIDIVSTTLTTSVNASFTGSALGYFWDSLILSDGTTTEYYALLSDGGAASAGVVQFIGSPSTPTVGGFSLPSGPSTLIWAKYLSDTLSDPTTRSRIHLEQLLRGGPVLTIQATHGDEYVPSLPLGDETPLPMNRDVESSLCQWSKENAPEHFLPGVNYEWVGENDKAVLGAVPAGNRLLVFKEDGIFVIFGAGELSGFSFDRLDTSHLLLTPRHLAGFDSDVVGWFNRGVCIVSADGRVTNLTDHRIEQLFSEYLEGDGNLKYDSFNKEVIFTLYDVADASYAPRCLVWNANTDTWTSWDTGNGATIPKLSVRTDDVGVLGVWSEQSGDVRLWYPRFKSTVSKWELYTDTGYSTVATVTIATSTVLTGTWSQRRFALTVGDLVYDPVSGLLAVITAVTTDTPTNYNVAIVILTGTNDTNTYKRFYQSIDVNVELVPQADKDVSQWKRWDEVETVVERGYFLRQLTHFVRSSQVDTPQSVSELLDGSLFTGSLTAARPRIILNGDHMQSLVLRPGFSCHQAGMFWQVSAITLVSREESRRWRS